MCLLWSRNWIFIFQKTAFFIVTAVKTSNLTIVSLFFNCRCICACHHTSHSRWAIASLCPCTTRCVQRSWMRMCGLKCRYSQKELVQVFSYAEPFFIYTARLSYCQLVSLNHICHLLRELNTHWWLIWHTCRSNNFPTHFLHASIYEKSLLQFFPVSNAIHTNGLLLKIFMFELAKITKSYRRQVHSTTSIQWLIGMMWWCRFEVKTWGHHHRAPLSRVTYVGSFASSLTSLVSFWTNTTDSCCVRFFCWPTCLLVLVDMWCQVL
jgi:hypothetical protein